MQWEYQVGPSVGIEAGDHIWISRYILEVPQTIIKDFPHIMSFYFFFFFLIIRAYSILQVQHFIVVRHL
jgi:hypothetical protein